MAKKIKIVNKMKFYKHKGKKLIPLTDVEARSLDKGDTVKYVGPITPEHMYGYSPSGYGSTRKDAKPFSYIARRAYVLRSRPDVFTKKDPRVFFLRINYYDTPLAAPIEHFALVSRGDPHTSDLNKALRLVPEHLFSFKRNIEVTINRAKKKIDKYLNTLPIHKRMEVFKALTKEQQAIYDFLSSGFEKDMLKEETDETNEGPSA